MREEAHEAGAEDDAAVAVGLEVDADVVRLGGGVQVLDAREGEFRRDGGRPQRTRRRAVGVRRLDHACSGDAPCVSARPRRRGEGGAM